MENKNLVDVTFIAVVTGDGIIYLKRNEDDDIEPGKWCLPSGHVESGEAYKSAAVRELYEETGIKANPKELEHIGTFPYMLDGTMFRVWLYFVEKGSLSLNDVVVFEEEHSDKKCIGIDTLAAMRTLRTDNGERFTAIDMHIIANYVPEVAARIKAKENNSSMRNISKAL
ncbi:MAG: NUDIX hydrolase [Methanothrix sp.]